MVEETRKTKFAASKGAELAGALELPNGAPRAYALFAHCFTCSKDILAAREIARALRSEGFAVLRFDFTGLGASTGEFGDTNFSSNVDDLVSAADYLRREFRAPEILIGHSLGGAAAIVAAQRIAETKGVAVIGAPSDARHVARRFGARREEIVREGEAQTPLAGRVFTIKKQFLTTRTRRCSRRRREPETPALILHSPLDATVAWKTPPNYSPRRNIRKVSSASTMQTIFSPIRRTRDTPQGHLGLGRAVRRRTAGGRSRCARARGGSPRTRRPQRRPRVQGRRARADRSGQGARRRAVDRRLSLHARRRARRWRGRARPRSDAHA
ncbi:MAG: alpha/beta fold hydrolase [Parvularculaceae bacterium]